MLYLNKIEQPGNSRTLAGRLALLTSSLTPIVQQRSAINPEVTRIAFESADQCMPADREVLENSVKHLQSSLTAISDKLKIKAGQTQHEAAIGAAHMCGDHRKAWAMESSNAELPKGHIGAVVNAGGVSDAMTRRIAALEAFDTRETKLMTEYTIGYNFESAQQEPFAEMLFPTIVCSPDTVGFQVSVRLSQVFDGITRNISGDITEYNKRNLLRAFADSTILKNDTTMMIPIYRDNSKHHFVDSAVIPPYQRTHEGDVFTTAPIAVGAAFDYMALCQPDSMVAAGINDVTDSIDPAIQLHYVYLKVGDDVIKVNASALPGSTFTAQQQGLQPQMQLIFNNNSVVIPKTNYKGQPLVTLKPIVDNEYRVRLSVNMTGSLNTELGNTEIFGNSVKLYTITNNKDELVDLTTPEGIAVKTLLTGAKILGYDLIAYRPNINRRQVGQLIDTTFYTQVYSVPLRAPITALHPITEQNPNDNSDLTALVNATRVRTSNAAVKTLLEASDILAEYSGAKDVMGMGPEVLGMGRFLVKPVYIKKEIDMEKVTQSLRSKDRGEDIQMALVNIIRDLVFAAYRDSEYAAAANMVYGINAPVPTPVLATDQYLSRYLMVDGDLRTVGADFSPRIVTTMDNRIKGKIFITFVNVDEATRHNEPDPLSFGCMAYYPELVIVTPMQRNGGIRKELAVSPRFRHLVNCPILIELDVKNLDKVTGGLSISVSGCTLAEEPTPP